MDYSSIAQDPDVPDEHSPWASASPRQSRTNFTPSGEPPSPSQARLAADSLTGRPSEDGSEGQQQDDTLSQAPTAIENGRLEGESESLPYRQPDGPQTPGTPQDAAAQQQPQQPRPSSQQRYRRNQSGGQRPPNTPAYRLQAKVTGLERTGRKDPILRFDVYTNLPGFRTTQFRDVRRTHSEFAKLADHLISANPEAIVPATPPAATSAGVGTDEDEARVKTMMQRWLNAVCASDVLMRDEEMVRFVEGDPGYSPVVRRSQPATGVRRKYIKQFAPPPDDTPELLEARPVVKRFYLGTMDAGQKVDKVVRNRRSLGLAESDFGMKLSALTESETHPGLRNGLRKLGKTIQTRGDLLAAQGTAEATTLSDPLAYASADSFIVKETLTNRHILLRELIQAQQQTRAKLSATDRLKASSSVRRDKVDEAIANLDEARHHETYLAQKTQRVTANLLHEQRRWFARSAADLRYAIREFVVREIEAERRALATLEAVRPDVRAIDASGGLSRLGREATPAARRASLQSSQGPKGDAWSGVNRRERDGVSRSIVAGAYVGSTANVGGRPDSSGGFGPAGQPIPEEEEADPERSLGGRERAASAAGSAKGVEDDDDRIDARNAASRLAASTF